MAETKKNASEVVENSAASPALKCGITDCIHHVQGTTTPRTGDTTPLKFRVHFRTTAEIYDAATRYMSYTSAKYKAAGKFDKAEKDKEGYYNFYKDGSLALSIEQRVEAMSEMSEDELANLVRMAQEALKRRNGK